MNGPKVLINDLTENRCQMAADGKIDVEKTDAAFKAALPSTAPKPYMDLFNKIIINCTTSVPCTNE
jgi:hypothetical protein